MVEDEGLQDQEVEEVVDTVDTVDTDVEEKEEEAAEEVEVGERQISKLVVDLTETQALIGIQAKDCDPYLTTVTLATGEKDPPIMDQVIDQLPYVFGLAQAQWQQSSRYATYERPAPAARPARAAPTPRTGRQTPAKPNSAQQSLL